MSRELKGAVFDWDGTLASIDEREYYCLNNALAEHDSGPITREFYLDNYYRRAYELGTGPRMVLETALIGKSRTLVEAAYESYRLLFQGSPDKATLQKGALSILKTLKQTGFKIGIATMRYTRWVIEKELDLLSVASFVDTLQTRQDLGVKGPFASLTEAVDQRATLVTNVLARLDLKPQDVFLVGDSWWDVRAGKRLGIKTVLVRTGFAAYNDFASEKSEITVSSLPELQTILQAKNWKI
jgi:phosphoglycolate phosphatase-like HAD superfamily hydrolase